MIFSDLDGTLLDARTYSFAAARPALRAAAERGVPLILCSSKTRGEMELYRRRLGNRHPFITENGGGIFIPEGYFPFTIEGSVSMGGYSALVLGRPYREVREIFRRACRATGVAALGFGDLASGELARLTGLTEEEARLAAERDFDEPFVPPEGEIERESLLAELASSGLQVTKAGFYHVAGDHDKGRAVRMLIGMFRRSGGHPLFAGLGDGLNDIPLLAAVDRPFLVRRPDGGYAEGVDLPGLIRTRGVGPSGWNEAVMGLLAP